MNLEERLRRVEVFVGGADAADDFSKTEARTGLAEIMEDLRMRVQMLNPSNADGIHARLNQVLAKLREVSTTFVSFVCDPKELFSQYTLNRKF